MNVEQNFYQNRIREELAQRCSKNPRYSLRSFARSLQLDPGALSRILSGKQIPSPTVAKKMLSLLDLKIEEQLKFMESLGDAHRARNLERMSPVFKKKLETRQIQGQARELSPDLFRVISDWYHYAILELTFVQGFQSEPKWIATQLGISETEAMLAVKRLKDLELLTESKSRESRGRLVKSDEWVTTADKTQTSSALKRRQKQIFEKAAISIDEDPVESRNFTAITLSTDPAKIPVAKARIQEFSRELCRYLESGKRLRVYEFACLLFPLQLSVQTKNQPKKQTLKKRSLK